MGISPPVPAVGTPGRIRPFASVQRALTDAKEAARAVAGPAPEEEPASVAGGEAVLREHLVAQRAEFHCAELPNGLRS
jgi:hypothetical protein